jgi:hypothetical protein
MPRIDRSSSLDVAKLLQSPQSRQLLEEVGVTADQVKRAAGADGVLSHDDAVALLGSLSPRQTGAATDALARLMADPALKPAGAVSAFDAMLGATAARAGGSEVRPPVDLQRPLTIASSQTDGEPLVYVSARTVEGEIDPLAALGSYGPLGAHGPLGTLGPVGDNYWNPSTWIDQANKLGTGWDGLGDDQPLTEAGPLGERGPLSDVYFDGALFAGDGNSGDDLAGQLRGLGHYAVLGPLGPLGPMGALGPLGPVGAHGFGADDDGTYLDAQGQARRSVDVRYDAQGTTHTWELYERYTESFAKGMDDNDTSFMVEGRLAYEGGGAYETDEFSFTSNSDQLVTVCVVPEKSLDDFDFEITDAAGEVLVTSDSDDNIDWAQLQVKKGTKLNVRVKLKDSAHWFSKDYRLFVTGSTERFAQSMNDGAHVREQGG